MNEMRPAIFLDRDGVLIRNQVVGGKPYAITDGDPVEILDGVEEACRTLSQKGFVLVMVTNQPDVVAGRTSRSFVDETNSFVAQKLKLDHVEVCFHDDRANCLCRKPKPGMILAAADKCGLDLKRSFMIGDRWRDVEAGQSAGCSTVFVNYGYSDERPTSPDHVSNSLRMAVDWIEAQMSRRTT
jgi:D-glycero-D-manno-heptose 1,7-bisphosphate phosphatase